MKFINKILALALVVVFATVATQAQFSSSQGAFPGVPSQILATTRTNVNSVIYLPNGCNGFSMGATMVATNASASNVVFGLSFSMDGVNFTAEKFRLVQILTDTTVSVGFTNWTKDTFGSPAAVRLDYITNSHLMTIIVSNVSYKIQ